MSDDKPNASNRMWQQEDTEDSKKEEEDFHPQHALLHRGTVAATNLVPTDTDSGKALIDAGLRLVHLFPGDDAVVAVRCSDNGPLHPARKIGKTVVYYQQPDRLKCAIADCPYYQIPAAKLFRRVFAVGELAVAALDPEAIQAGSLESRTSQAVQNWPRHMNILVFDALASQFTKVLVGVLKGCRIGEVFCGLPSRPMQGPDTCSYLAALVAAGAPPDCSQEIFLPGSPSLELVRYINRELQKVPSTCFPVPHSPLILTPTHPLCSRRIFRSIPRQLRRSLRTRAPPS
jgi:hypothetical protein